MSRKGLLLSLSSAYLVSVCSLGAKKSEIPVGELSFVTFCFLFIISLPLVWINIDPTFPKKELTALWGRSFVSVPILLASYQASRLMPLADEALLAYTSIAFTVLFARIFLGEPCGFDKVASTCAVLFGVGLITGRPVGPTYPNYAIGVALAFSGAVFDAGSYIFLKKLTHLHYSVIIFHYSLSSIFLTLPLSLIESWTYDLSLIWVPLLGAIQEICVTLALTTEQAGIVCLIHASDIVFSYIWELVFYNEDYTFLRLAGSAIVSLAIVITSLMTDSDEEEKDVEENPVPKIV